MKKTAFALFLVVLAFSASSCKKSNTSAEAGLVAETTPANQSNNLNMLGPKFPLKVEIISAIPANGVKIDITAKKDGSADPAFFTTSTTTNAPQNNYTITQTPPGVTCVVNITVTSLTKADNVWRGIYRYSEK